MSAQTPIGEDAYFEVRVNEHGVLAAYFDNGHDGEKEIAWLPPEGDRASFEWLVGSAAAFHKQWLRGREY